MFNKMPSCTKSPNSTDATRIKEALSNSESSSVYVELKKILDKMPDRMQENVQKEHVSHIFQDNPYEYAYYDYKFDVNVSTIGVKQYGEFGVINYIYATVPGSSHAASSPP